MDNLNSIIQEYTLLLGGGNLQKAYRSILTAMSGLQSHLIKAFPECASGALYQGYLDMTYFALTTPTLRDKKLKIAVVYLHEQGVIELWLAAVNRKIQSDFINLFKNKDTLGYNLTEAKAGVDSILVHTLPYPDFNDIEALKKFIAKEFKRFTEAILLLI